MSKLVIAEKPSVGMALAKVLGAYQRQDGYMEGSGYLVSWCVGHLVGLSQPDAYDEKYRKWRRECLPIIPEQWRWEVASDKKAQFKILKELMFRSDVDEIICATEDGTLENLYSIIEDYGVEPAEGIVVEEDREYYAFQAPYILLPDIAEDEITSPLIEENYYAIMPIAQGLNVDNAGSDVTALLTTSSTSFSKVAGYELTTYEKEEGDIDGSFAVAVSIACDNDGQIVWFSSSNFLDDTYNSYSSGANIDMAMNAFSSMLGENEAVAIRSKSLNYNYLTISDSQASVLKGVMIGAFPLAYLGLGIVVILRRRKLNESV